MPKLNSADVVPSARSTPYTPLRVTSTAPTAVTHEGAPAFTRTPETALFLMATTQFWDEATFYTPGNANAVRFRTLVQGIALNDPAWLTGFLGYLRSTANMRTGALVAAAEMARARQDAGEHGYTRQAVNAVLQRADEPGAIIRYYLSRYATAGRHARGVQGLTLPIAFRRGVVDGVMRLYTEKSTLKWDSPGSAVRFGDVVDLVGPANPTYGNGHVRGTPQGDLFEHLIDRRHNRGNAIPATLPTLRARARLMDIPVAERRDALRSWGGNGARFLREAGMTHEALAGWLEAPLTADDWAMILPSMGYAAQLRNLRNLDQAGVPDDVAGRVAERLADPAQVRDSRQLPFRFLSAYSNLASDRWRMALGRAFQESTGNIPALPGRTLVLVDVSGSMTNRLSSNSTVSRMMIAALFGVALASKGEAVDLHGFADHVFAFPVARGSAVLREAERFVHYNDGGTFGHGTRIAAAIKSAYQRHDRVIVITDEQTSYDDHYQHGNVTDAVPRTVPLWCFNTTGEPGAVVDAGTTNRYLMGGLSDHTFAFIPRVEAGMAGQWPFAVAA